MQWINEQDLVRWSKLNDARALLADMVADLIRATIRDASRFRFPGGDVGQVRGWDGDLQTVEAVGRVPAGNSKWEFGAGAGSKKASADYEKRTSKTDPDVMQENTLVLVNLEPWDTPREMLTAWEGERRDEKKWRDVRYIDGVELVHWLDEYPAVAARYARDVLNTAPKEGALSTDEYWEMFSLQFKPRLHEKVVVADRQQLAGDLVQKLQGPSQTILLGSETNNEVLAFTVAAIRLAPPEVRRAIELRTLIVETQAAARFLSQKSGMSFITTGEADALAGLLATRGPTVSAAVGAQSRKPEVVTLQRATAEGMSDGFEAMGLDRQAGYELAHRCGRSLTILRRLIANGPAPRPEWVAQASKLKPAFLAGGWSAGTALDKAALQDLASGTQYKELEDVLFPTLRFSDPPFDRVKEYWQVRAPVDAFSIYAPLISDDDLSRFRTVFLRVFSHVVPQPSRQEKFSFDYKAPDQYSKWLRDGIALTVLIIAAMHDVGGLQIAGQTVQEYVDRLLKDLPDLGSSHEILVGLGDQTSLLAEAAPNPFLTALESMLGRARDEVKKMFSAEDDHIFAPSSPHIQLLWALETLAWDPKHFNRACLVLAQLAEVDPTPDSRMANRPLNSLREIFLGWSPGTYAPLAQRVSCLDQILKISPDVGWRLLLKLMPKAHDSATPTRKPKLRDPAPIKLEAITFGAVWDFEAAIAERAIKAAEDMEDRAALVAQHLPMFRRPDTRSALLRYLDEFLQRRELKRESPVWQALRDEVARHDHFADAEWAMPQNERDEIRAVIAKHAPDDPFVEDRPLFDEWLPHVRDPGGGDNVDQLRIAAIDRILVRDGVVGVVNLAQVVRLPELIGQALASSSVTEAQLAEILRGSISGADKLAFAASAIGAERYGESWRAYVSTHVLPLLEPASRKADLLLGWPMSPTTWDFLSGLDAEVRSQYWRQVQRLPLQGSLDDLIYAIDRVREVGRDLDVLSMLHRRVGELPSQLVLDILAAGLQQISSGQAHYGPMPSYYLKGAFKALSEKGDATDAELAALEYGYFPILDDVGGREQSNFAIHRLMAHDAATFVELLSHVFRPKGVDAPADPSDEDRARARTSYRVLHSFRRIPGDDEGVLDAAALNKWVDEVRELARQADRAEIADQYIGKLLAHAPAAQDGAWPPSPICDLIERIGSDDVETGIRIERFNMRGATWRAMHAGGSEERELAAKYNHLAELAAKYPRTSAMLRVMAEHWIHYAEQEDVQAELRKMER